MLTRSTLTREEREELRRALVLYKARLERQSRGPFDRVAMADARWRVFVVESMLAELRD